MYQRPLGRVTDVVTMGVQHQRQSPKARCEQRRGAAGEYKMRFHAVEPAPSGEGLPDESGEATPPRAVVPMRGDHVGRESGITQPISNESASGWSVGCRVTGGDDQQAHGARR